MACDCEHLKESNKLLYEQLIVMKEKMNAFEKGIMVEIKDKHHPINGECKGHSIIVIKENDT
jgi:hypothetical protein